MKGLHVDNTIKQDTNLITDAVIFIHNSYSEEVETVCILHKISVWKYIYIYI